MITQLNNQPKENNSILEILKILKMNDDKRLQSECHIYINGKGTFHTIHESMRHFRIDY